MTVTTENITLTDVEETALEWLRMKDIEAEAKKAEKVRKAAGILLKRILGADNTVTLNRGGFKKYQLKVTECQGRPSGDRALDAMLADGIITLEQRDKYMEASRGAGYETIALKAVKA